MTDGLRVGRYVIHDEFAAGGMASVHLGRLLGPAGFSRTVAVKRLHPQYAKDPEFVAMLLDEARLAGRVRHPNVVTTLDVVALRGELFLVMEYVAGDALSTLLRASRKQGVGVEPAIVSAVVGQVLLGLQAAHEATDERGRPLRIVHRDVSPQNVLVGTDGAARVVDFGVAKAASRIQTTSEGQLKGKLGYMAPEQLLRRPVDHRADLFAAGIMIWEALVGQRLFGTDDPAAAVARVLACEVEPPSALCDVPRAVDEFMTIALAPRAADRFGSAKEMAIALQEVLPAASSLQVGEWVALVGGEGLRERARRIAELESSFPEPFDWEPSTPLPLPEAALPARAARATQPTLPDPAPASEPAEAERTAGAKERVVIRLTPAQAALLVIVAAGSVAALWALNAPSARAPAEVSEPAPAAASAPQPAAVVSASESAPPPVASSSEPASEEVPPRRVSRTRSAYQARPPASPPPKPSSGLAPIKVYR